LAKKHNKLVEKQVDAPDDMEGIIIKTPDFLRQEPMDFLLQSKIQKRNQQPLTVGEIVHSGRQTALQKLEIEIKNLQAQGNQYREFETNYRMECAKSSEGMAESGPMAQAVHKLKKRLFEETFA
jgi:hypothetical protein